MATTKTKKKTTAKKTAPTRKKKSAWGGRREGAGRPAGTKMKDNPRNKMLPFRVSETTAQRIKRLRELTKDDETTFVDMLDSWVAGLAKDYGIE